MVTPGLPYMSAVVNLDEYPDRGSQWHWHNEVEFFYVREGELEYRIPGSTHVFRKGEAGFINSNVLHMSRGIGDEPVVQELHIFLPAFIAGHAAGDIERRYIRPVLRAGGMEIVRISNVEPMVADMRRANDAYSMAEEGFEFQVRALMSGIWMMLFREMRVQSDGDGIRTADDGRIKNMLSFIAGHYAEQVEVEDIAAAGQVGKRECFRIFNRKLGTTPMDYLIWQRITRAAELLRSTDTPIQHVAEMVGFLNASYFGKVFKERMGVTPRKYRMIQ